jgi:Trk-type K+ transport system membrane component
MGTIAFFLYWNHNQFYSDSIIENLFLAIFQAISAFNNAGISFIEGGMTSPLFRHEHYIQYITGFLIFLGGIGFITINDVFYTVSHNPHKKRFWTRLQVMSRIIVKMSLIIIAVGTFAFFVFEFNNVSHGASLSDRISTAFFSTISCRTAGFSLLDTNLLSTPTIIIFLVLMFIGGSPSSTAGGIKITTFYILIKSALSTIRGRKEVSICNRAVPFSLVDRAYAVVLFSLTIIFFGSLIIAISDPQCSFKEIIFEVISALGTVGLSMGITPELTFVGKFTLIIIMFVGRITILTIAISVVRKAMYTNYSLAKTNLNL